MAFVLAAVAVVSLTVFFATGASRQRSARVAQAGGSPLLSVPLLEYGVWMTRPFVQLATSLHISPDVLSWASLFFHFGAAFELALGRADWAVLWLILGGACDMLDGAVARARGVASDAGEVLDAVVDRWAEMAVLFGLAYWYRDFTIGFGLALWAAAGSLMVSYTRAKSQAMGVAAPGGWMQRHERAAFLVIAVFLSALLTRFAPVFANWPILAALGLIAALSTVASMQRTQALRAALRDRQ